MDGDDEEIIIIHATRRQIRLMESREFLQSFEEEFEQPQRRLIDAPSYAALLHEIRIHAKG